MNFSLLILCAATVVFATGCHTEEPAVTFEQNAGVTQRATVTSDSIESEDKLTSVLETRWPLEMVTKYCIPERRHNPAYQNLVVDSDESWRGELHTKEDTKFDKIFWYATVADGKLGTYSLNAQLGDDFWLLEIGNVDTLKSSPDVSPDPSRPNFVGPEKK